MFYLFLNMSLISEYSDIEEYTDDYYSENYIYEENVFDIWNNCVVLSLFSIIPNLGNIIITNFCFGCLLTLDVVPKNVMHFLSGSIGVFLLTTLESQYARRLIFGCFIFSYLLLRLSYYLRNIFSCANFLKIVTVTLLVLCEYYFVEPEIWLQIRGIVMVLVMKLISLGDDIEEFKSLPNSFQYFSYTLCGANVLVGPWISFSDYLNFYTNPTRKNWWWIISLFQVLLTSCFYLTLSNCWSNYLIPEGSNRWFVAYKEAFSFRTSHYFISYLAESGMIAAGFTNSNTFRFTITEPLHIELPSSLSIVVRKWNQPMHEFLKKYVYRSWLRYGKFPAIFATFFISSLFHGFEIKISVVLLSIGIFSYLQVAPRERISEIFDCCVKVRPCKDCKHKYKRDNGKVKLVLVIYSFATIVHLAYLGILMDASTDQVGIYEKWQNLYFISHIVMFFNMMIIL